MIENENPTLASKKVYKRVEESMEIRTTPETKLQDIEELLLIANDHDLEVTEEDIIEVERNGNICLTVPCELEISGTGYNNLIWPDVVPVETVMETLKPGYKQEKIRYYVVSNEYNITKETIESGIMDTLSNIPGVAINNPNEYFYSFEEAEDYLKTVISEDLINKYKIVAVEM